MNNGANTLIGWINYFTNSKIEDFITDEIKKERFRNGIITTLSEKAPSCDNQLDVNKAISFRDVLSQNEILNWRN